jgi:hypothetical protein
VSDFQTYDSVKQGPSIAFQTADGVEAVPDDEPVQPAEPEHTEIRIVTGQKGRVLGSKVFVNGQEIPRLTYFSVSGIVGECWETVIHQVVGHE